MIRDIVLLVLLFLMTLAGVAVYVKVSRMLKTANRALENVDEIVSTVSEKVVAPAAAGSGAAFGLGKVAAFLFGARKRKSNKKRD